MTYGLFNITDAAAATIAKRENSSYSLLLMAGNIGYLINPFIVGPLVDNQKRAQSAETGTRESVPARSENTYWRFKVRI